MMRMRHGFLTSETAAVLGIVWAASLILVSMQRDVNAQASAKVVKGKAQSKVYHPDAKAVMQSSPVPRPESLMASAPDPATVYRVEPIPIRGIVRARTPQQERSVKAASSVVSKLRPIPDERIRFFGWMNEANSTVVFAGWSAFVQQASPTPEGQLITLRVSALARTRSGDPIGVRNNFIEEYLWADGNLRYLVGYPCPIIGDKPIISRF